MKKILILLILLIAVRVEAQTKLRTTYTDYCKDAVLCLTFDPEQDKLLDISGNDNHITNFGADYITDGSCKYGNCFDFVASNTDYIDLTTMGDLGTDLDAYLIMSVWVKTTTTTSMILFGTVNDGNTTAINMNLNLSPALSVSAGRCHIFKRDENNNYFRTGVASDMGFTDGEWHNIILSIGITSADSQIWVDSIPQAITAGGTNGDGIADNMANFDYPIFMGTYNNRGSPLTPYLNGELDEVMIKSSTVALTDAEAKDIYNNGLR